MTKIQMLASIVAIIVGCIILVLILINQICTVDFVLSYVPLTIQIAKILIPEGWIQTVTLSTTLRY